jgi:Uma2 family endonuclease
MGMPAPTQRWTADQVRALIDESRHWPRYELIDGELLVTPAPRLEHQEAVGLLLQSLYAYVRAQRIGHAFASPADIELGPGIIVQPDVFVVPLVEGRRPNAWPEIGSLLLAVEVLSPGSARYDRVTKRRFYARAGVPEYWVVDLDARIIERWRAGDERPEPLDERLVWHPEGASESFTLDLPSFFAEVHDEREA